MRAPQWAASGLVIGFVLGLGVGASNPYIKLTFLLGGLVLLVVLAKAAQRHA